ncbi:hypothetical protein MAPG_00443 [Magnaporthiopsis poae ATCC 64411]|uniref:Uncharacterized protein n=1 Tax=Magnaporthiopsis poae (strain ATCC 64411 / 73-15) TaxID=644358 RepID=A0A0C4DL10_MAGP6|nr:hypothetical protein MAPG_00443 [Magnaporthiopsis poae ATCC 64411]
MVAAIDRDRERKGDGEFESKKTQGGGGSGVTVSLWLGGGNGMGYVTVERRSGLGGGLLVSSTRMLDGRETPQLLSRPMSMSATAIPVRQYPDPPSFRLTG